MLMVGTYRSVSKGSYKISIGCVSTLSSHRLDIGERCLLAVNTSHGCVRCLGLLVSRSSGRANQPTYFYPCIGSIANLVTGLTGCRMSLRLSFILRGTWFLIIECLVFMILSDCIIDPFPVSICDLIFLCLVLLSQRHLTAGFFLLSCRLCTHGGWRKSFVCNS